MVTLRKVCLTITVSVTIVVICYCTYVIFYFSNKKLLRLVMLQES